jgi:hypothetical protein
MDQITTPDTTQIRVVTGLMTGHCNLRYHLHYMGIFTENPVCRLCNVEEATISHMSSRTMRWVGHVERREKCTGF